MVQGSDFFISAQSEVSEYFYKSAHQSGIFTMQLKPRGKWKLLKIRLGVAHLVTGNWGFKGADFLLPGHGALCDT